MKHIERLIAELAREDYLTTLRVTLIDDGYEAALCDEEQGLLCDRLGDKLLVSFGDSIQQALSGLDAMCAVGL